MASVVLFAALLQRTGVARPVAGAITGAVCFTGNLVVTRTTFALGLAIALGALLALVSDACASRSVLSVLARAHQSGSWFVPRRSWRCALPLWPATRRRGLAVSALVPTVAIGLAFGNGGYQTFGAKQALMGFLVCLAVAGLCWRRPVVRWGALLSAGLVAAAYVIPTPVGTTATRLPELFAAPIVVAVATVPLVALIAATASVVLLLPPVIDHRGAKSGAIPRSARSSMRPCLSQLTVRRADGPIEVVPTQRRGEAAFVAPVVPIARGWSRQLDTGRNPIFYDGTLNADTYRKWLDDNAISYVALSNGPYDWSAPNEADSGTQWVAVLASTCGRTKPGPSTP